MLLPPPRMRVSSISLSTGSLLPESLKPIPRRLSPIWTSLPYPPGRLRLRAPRTAAGLIPRSASACLSGTADSCVRLADIRLKLVFTSPILGCLDIIWPRLSHILRRPS